jgi:diguanylate cyclase (GGDEF)-like protein/PAS domain S-box-containing protein
VLVLSIAVAAALLAGLAFGRLRPRRRPRRDVLSRLAAESFPGGGLLMFDRRLRHVLATGRGLRALGLAPREVEGRTVREVFPAEAGDVFEPTYRAALEGRESAFELAHGDRDHLHRVVPVRDRSGEIVAGMVVIQDITDRKNHEHRLRQWASRDGLTGLWNRERLLQELEHLLAEGRRRDDRPGSLLFVDLDGFKAVNDTLGHAAGDDLLRRVARELEARVRYTDAVARLGGDEFAVLLPGTDARQAGIVAEKLAGAVEAVWPSGLRGGASIGIAEIRRGATSAADVLARADSAMYDDKWRRAS